MSTLESPSRKRHNKKEIDGIIKLLYQSGLDFFEGLTILPNLW